MRINLSDLMRSAWQRFRSEGNRFTFATCLKLAWMEAKGQKGYTFRLEAERAAITAYLMKLVKLQGTHRIRLLQAGCTGAADATYRSAACLRSCDPR